jgi:hypothetical protein
MKRKIFSKLLMGAFLIASVSMFVSCKDYDDDIQKNAQDIAALRTALGADISGAKSELTAQLATVTSQLDQLKKDIAAKADASALTSKAEASELTDLTARVAVLETQIKKLAELEAALAGKADASALEEIEGKLKAIDGKIDGVIKEDKVKELIQAALTTLDIQGEATKVFDEKIKDALKGYLTEKDLEKLTESVGALEDLLKDNKIKDLLEKDLMGKDEIGQAITDSLEKKFQALNDSVEKKVTSSLSAIEIFVNKKLTSIVLKPDFYWEGIEGIETPFLWNQETYAERGEYEFTYKAIDPAAGVNEVKVWVKKTMGWGDKDGKAIDNRELGKYVVATSPAHHMDATEANIANVYYSTTAYGAEAKYHINPSVADLEGAAIGFYDHAANVYTRGDANPSISPKAKSAVFGKKDSLKYNTLNNGILTVPFEVNYGAVLKYFLGWTASQTDKWEGYKGKIKDEYGKAVSWGAYTWDKVTGAFDKDAVAGGDEYAFTGKLPFVSLQIDVPAKDEKWEAYSVNSDYAVVVPGIYDIVALADIDPNTGLDKETFIKPAGKHEIRKNHLYETVGYNDNGIQAEDADEINIKGSFNQAPKYGAIPMPATHELVYNDTVGIDLLDFVRTHYDYITFAQYGTSKFDATLDTWTKNPATAAQYGGGDLFNKLGLSYKFTVIDYTVGTKITSESAHVQQYASKQYKDKDGNAINSRFVARSVETTGTGKDDFKTILDKTATREAIDREPLVRVDLYDADGKIIRYGYIKIRIVDATTTLKDQVVTIPLADIYMNCGDEAVVKWHQVENLILGKLDMTKNEFEKQYKLDVYGNYKFVPFLKPENFIDPVTGKTAKDLGDKAGTLYTRSWQAKRYYQKEDGSFAAALDEYTTGGVGAWTNTNNHFGEVWYTPEDNTTAGHTWDEQTNVLMWNFFQGNETDKDDYAKSRVWTAPVMKKEEAGNMDKEKYNKLMDVLNIDYDSKGINKNDTLSTVVRFINKNTNTSVYVILSVGKEKVHFQYGEVDKKDWSHWFQFNSVKNGETDAKFPYWKEFDTRLNPFKPSNVAYRFLEVTDLNQKLTDHWMDPANMVTMLGTAGKFKAFSAESVALNTKDGFNDTKADGTDADNLWKLDKFAPIVTFQFVYPSDGSVDKLTKNSTIDCARDKAGNPVSWDVKGASGAVWTLAIRSHADNTKAGSDAIVAIKKKDPKGKVTDPYIEEICYIDGTEAFGTTTVNKNKIIYHGLEDNANLYPAATDLINLSGAYNAWGDPRFKKGDGDGLNNLKSADFLEKNIDEAFTAYLKINVTHECYDPLISKQFFNLRFHRPINVVGKKVEWSDMVLADNTIAIRDLVEIVDWNTYPLVSYNASEVKANNTEFGMDFPAYKDVYASAGKMKAQNKGIPYEYYGIQELAVRYDEIRTDHAKLPDVRTANNAKMYTTDYSWITDAKNTDLVKALPSMTSPREYNGTDRNGKVVKFKTITLLDADGKIVPFDVAHAWNHSDYTGTPSTSGNTQYGRLFYNNDASDTQLFHIYVPIAVKYNWGNIAYDDKLGDAAGKKLDFDYTQTVWAIITVKGTH